MLENNKVAESESQEPTPERHLEQAVKLALEDDRPRAVAAWLRRIAHAVECGEYEE